MLAAAEMTVLLGGEGPDAISPASASAPRPGPASPRPTCRSSTWCRRCAGAGIGRALLEATIEAAREVGATGIDLNTGATDTAARALYESAGFSNREGEPDGPAMLFYEREI